MEVDDIVVTHHLPTTLSVPKRFKNEAKNAFFVTNCEHLFRVGEPRVWVHGHTHDSCDYTYEGTRVMCNPRGYWPGEMNPKFSEGLVIDV